jgi:hypothetical protein
VVRPGAKRSALPSFSFDLTPPLLIYHASPELVGFDWVPPHPARPLGYRFEHLCTASWLTGVTPPVIPDPSESFLVLSLSFSLSLSLSARICSVLSKLCGCLRRTEDEMDRRVGESQSPLRF